jgi:hypothetical protein
MKIHFERTGGIAGVHDSIDLDTKSMSGKEAEEILDAFKKAKFLRATSEKGSAVDVFNYTISIQHEVTADDDTKTARDLRPLIDLLMSKLKTPKKQQPEL